MMRLWLPAVLLVSLLMACSSDSYTTGDGRYSYMSADFAEGHCATAGAIDWVLTDEGATLQLAPVLAAKWAAVPDSTYRLLLYYDYQEGAATVRPRQAVQVPVMAPLYTLRPDTLRTDPLTLESAWVSTSGRYLNLRLALKTGTQDGAMARQTIGVRCDTTATATGHRYTFTLIHNQNGVPQYYTATAFASIPLTDNGPHDEVLLRVNTYQGQIERQF